MLVPKLQLGNPGLGSSASFCKRQLYLRSQAGAWERADERFIYRNKKRNRKPKVPEISIDREETCYVDTEQLPGDNVLFKREIFWSPSQQKTYIDKIPAGYEGDYGPNINSQLVSFKYINNMSIPKIKEFYKNIGILISESYISNRLTKKMDIFHTEKSELYEASLEVRDWQQIDDTG